MIELDNLVKEYTRENPEGKVITNRAVDGFSFSVKDGEVFGLLGPNGAGKTTTIKMLIMLTAVTSGEIRYNGMRLKGNEREIKKLIGVVPQHINFDNELTAGENMELHARLHRIPKEKRQRRIKELLEYVGLSEIVNEKVRNLSGGMKRRLLIARALIHEPEILFMDEPTVALDPQVRRKIWSLIKEMAASGVTIFLTTHYIEEAESLCDRVAIIKSGRLIAMDTPKAICSSLGRDTLEEAFIKLTGDKEGC